MTTVKTEIVIQRFNTREKKWKDHAWHSRGKSLVECQHILDSWLSQTADDYRVVERTTTIEDKPVYP
jgi:hypothetical protein